MVIEQCYDIHSIIRVSVRADIRTCHQIDTHLLSFRRDSLDSPADVIIDRYDAAPPTPPVTVVDDYEYGAGVYHRPTGRIRFDILGAPQSYYMDQLCLPINLIVQLALLRTGHTFLHGAGLSIQGNQVLFPAYPGTGKTTLVSAFTRMGAQLFGDDLCIVGDGLIFSYPQALSVYPHHLPVLGYSDRAVERTFRRTELLDSMIAPMAHSTIRPIKLIRFLLNMLRQPSVNLMPNLVFGDNAIASQGKLNEIVALERSGEVDKLTSEPVDLQALADQSATILWHEWHPWFHDLLLYDAMAESGRGTMRKFRQVSDLALGVFQSVKCSRVRIPSNWDNAKLVSEFPAFWQGRSNMA